MLRYNFEMTGAGQTHDILVPFHIVNSLIRCISEKMESDSYNFSPMDKLEYVNDYSLGLNERDPKTEVPITFIRIPVNLRKREGY